MAEAGPSTTAEQKTLADDIPIATRERAQSHSTGNSSYHDAHYDAQRIEKRPPSAGTVSRPPSSGIVNVSRPTSAGLANVSRPPSAGVANVSRPTSAGVASVSRTPSAGAASASSKAKGKRASVDFVDPPAETQPPLPTTIQESDDEDGRQRPQHARGDSYTKFSRPDSISRNNSNSVSRNNSKSTRRKNGESSMTALPERPGHSSQARAETMMAEDPDEPATQTSAQKSGDSGDEITMDDIPDDARPKNKQNRYSTQSTGSRKFRPPIHQSDLEKMSSGESAPIPPFAQSVADDYRPRRGWKDLPKPPASWLHELYVISYLIFFSFLGTLARTGIEWLTFYPGAIIITPVLWANFSGSFFMGFMAEDKKLFADEWESTLSITSRADKRMSKQSVKSKRSTFSQDLERMQHKERAKIKKTIPLYVGLTTGFCGSFTSFSIFARDMFLALANDTPSPINHPALPPDGADSIQVSSAVGRNGGYSFMALVAVMITTLALSIGGLIAGKQFAQLIEDKLPRIPTRFTRLFLDRLMIILGFGCWLGAIFLLIWPPDRPGGPDSAGDWIYETWRGVELFAMVFAPVGCLLRHYSSVKMNGLLTYFPLGTFFVNMLGTAIMAMAYDLQHIGIGVDGGIGGGQLGCQALEGIIDGFTGCLTTVSTWVAEIESLKRKHAWNYAFFTIVGGLCLVVAIMGPVYWTVGFSSPACVTSYTNKY